MSHQVILVKDFGPEELNLFKIIAKDNSKT